MGKDTRIKNISSGRAGQYEVEVVNGDGTFSALELASAAEAAAGTDANKVMTPAATAAAVTGLVTAASTTVAGKVELATSTEAQTGTDTQRAVTPKALADAVMTHVSAASETVAGKVELATDAEAKDGSNSSLALTPRNLLQGGRPSMGVVPIFPQQYKIRPALGTATYVHAAIPLTDAPQGITGGITQPDYPRVVTVKGNAGGIVGNVVISGTDADGEPLTDTIALNGDVEVSGLSAFETVTMITVPAETHAGTDTVSIGMDDVFGMPLVIESTGHLLIHFFDGSTDAGSLAINAVLAKNLYTMAGTPNNAKYLVLVYLV